MAEVTVLLSAAFKEAYVELVPQFERASGHKVETVWAPSVEIMKRMKDGEIVDLIIVSAPSIDELKRLGIVAADGRVDVATCGVGVSVKAGAPKPDISSGEAVKRAVLRAPSIVYSHGPSGVYLAGLFERMGIADAIRSKVTRVQGEPAGALVARGEAELGFQQVCELLPVPGIDLVGPLPPDIQEITTFSSGVHAKAREADAARALASFLTAPAAAPIIKAKGMVPISS